MPEVDFSGSSPDIGAVETEGIPAYYLPVIVEGNESVSGGGFYPAGEEAVLVAIADFEYYLPAYYGAIASGTDTAFVTLDANKTVTAIFVTNK